MNESVGHIISRFSWDTSFDKKERAFELQERLSGWSRINMPKEIVNVFDKICPPEQTWRIKSMEIDLGEIDFDNLEFELATKLRRQLNEKLIDLIIYANKSDNNIELINENTSYLDVISSFLLNGLMPWNYKQADGSVNQMLAYQLKNNHRNIIAMLREVGVTHQDVRKRIAWQINEPNIIEIIEGLEPNNHTQIIDFSDELTKIQEKETIVQASITDFKKNLWLWVLNYLLTERGTIFNKLAFMKSSIRQMANHYNIGYDELLELIERAVAEVSKKSDIKTGFILTLKALSKENESAKKKTGPANENTIGFWRILERHFIECSLQKSEFSKAEFNELVISLSKLDKFRFHRLIASFGGAGDLWVNIINDLNDSSIEAIFSTLSETKSAIVVESIYFLDKLGKETSLNIERKVLWEIGIKFLHSHKNASFDNEEFLDYCASELSKRKHVTREHILNQFTSATPPFSTKTMLGLEIYSDLSEIAQKNSTVYPSHINELIEKLSNQLVGATIDKELFVSLKRSLVKNIQLNPKAALEALIRYPDRDSLQMLIPYLLNDYTTSLLLKYAAKDTFSIILSIQRILNELKVNKKNIGLTELIEEKLMALGLNVIIFHPELKGSKFLEFMLNELSGLVPSFQFEQFGLFVDKLMADSKLGSHRISTAFFNKIKEKYSVPGKRFDSERTSPLLAASPNRRVEIGKPQSTIKNKDYQLKSGDKISGDTIFRLIEQCLTEASELIIHKGVEFHLSDLMDKALELKSDELKRIITNIPLSDKRIKLIKASVSFSQFSLWIINDASGSMKEAIEAMRLLYDIVSHIASGQLADELLDDYWKQTWILINTSTWSAENLKRLIQNSFHLLAKEANTNSGFIIEQIKKMDIRLTSLLKNALIEYLPAFSNQQLNEITKVPDDKLLKVAQKGLLDDLIYQLICQKQIPVWLGSPGEREVKDLLNEIVVHYPVKLLQVLKRELISEPQMRWLSQSVSFKELSASIGDMNKTQRSRLSILEKFYLSLGRISINGISAKEIQYIFFRKVLKAWTTNNWRIISTENIWNELVWDVCTKRGVSKKEFLQQIEKGKSNLPPSLQISFEYLQDQDRSSGISPDKMVVSKPLKQFLQKKYSPSIIKGGIAVRNAGVVLLNSYVPVLFERLGATTNKQFSNTAAQSDAVHYLQYVVTGLSSTEESFLPLNKVLCGLPLSQPVKDGIDISEANRKLIEDLILNAIGHWPTIGQCSINGFRGNWLVRDGMLLEHDDKWELTVEKRAYDALINKFPFSFSIIKYPWMPKALHVNWTY